MREETSAAEEATRRLRGDVLCLTLAPGEAVTERSLETTYGVSRTVVRQALTQMIYEGLVQRTQRGYVVAPFDFDELRELFAYRDVVEEAGVRLACQLAEVSELDAIQAEIDAGLREFTPEGWMEIGLDFHVRVAGLSRNRFLQAAVQEVTTRTIRARWLAISAGSGSQVTHDEHTEILRRIRLKDEDGAAEAVRAHAREVHEQVRTAIEASRRFLGRRSVVGSCS
ncbi:GntR family transcriptional regulator [Acuticoccus sp. M5D2P5]|uniref:GntR family transcriptional regulator n=1 Tax=Acuticoccus kalidii TaxID=2910977 RepID=UPI001F1FC95E|nr:GntR family transcriptional regulator [Acuticoccus kalidii]MCF3933094.1 GntR family transcriptional regulator [Acuticoccus kalidii]